MPRWQPDARGRLQQAALDLYAERGYAETSVADIAERAGLTKRTFFRHFADKREVLFAGSEVFVDTVLHATRAAPASATPLQAAAGGLAAAAPGFDAIREHARRRDAVIAATPELHERELRKLAALAKAMAGELRERGTGDPAAAVAAETAMAVFRVAFTGWIESSDDRSLSQTLDEAFSTLDAVAAPVAA